MSDCGELVCVNIVAVCNLGVCIDVKDLVRRYPYCHIAPRDFPAAMTHFEEPRLTFLISSLGKIVITGSQSIYATIYAIHRFIELLGDPNAKLCSLEVQNYTCTFNFDGMFELDRIAAENPKRVEYAPESFSGAHVRAGVGTIRHTIFTSGRLVLIGAKSELAAIESVNMNLEFYKKYIVPFADKHVDRDNNFELELDDVDDFDALLDEITL